MLPDNLCQAMRAGHVETVRKILSETPDGNEKTKVLNHFLLEVPDIYLDALLDRKCQKMNEKLFKTQVEYARIALDLGADVDFHGVYLKSTPLVAACKNGNFELVRLLVQRGATLHSDNDKKSIPIVCAMSRGHDHIFEFLMSHYSDFNAGSTPLWFFSMHNVHYLNKMLDHGADVSINRNGETALHFWVDHFLSRERYKQEFFDENHPILETLIRRGVDIWSVNNEGRTAMEITMAGSPWIADAILRKASEHQANTIAEETQSVYASGRKSNRL